MATTLTALRDRVEVILGDSTNAKWATGDIDEALRSAIAAYSQDNPHRAIAELELSTTGREIDISALVYSEIRRVWWDYDESDPGHPPRFRNFEVWTRDLLYINEPAEPATGDTIRVFYTAPHTLNGLDSATVTTIPDEHTAPLAQAAAGYAALTRAVDRTEQLNVDGWDFKRLREYADSQLAQFNHWLSKLTHNEAAQSAGIAPAYPLDRWDTGA